MRRINKCEDCEEVKILIPFRINSLGDLIWLCRACLKDRQSGE